MRYSTQTVSPLRQEPFDLRKISIPVTKRRPPFHYQFVGLTGSLDMGELRLNPKPDI